MQPPPRPTRSPSPYPRGLSATANCTTEVAEIRQRRGFPGARLRLHFRDEGNEGAGEETLITPVALRALIKPCAQRNRSAAIQRERDGPERSGSGGNSALPPLEYIKPRGVRSQNAGWAFGRFGSSTRASRSPTPDLAPERRGIWLKKKEASTRAGSLS